MTIDFIRELLTPEEARAVCSLSCGSAAHAQKRCEEISGVFAGKDNRLVLIVGPCSADVEDSVLDYMYRLAALQEKVEEKILIVPRLYTGKPRTNGSGYKGIIHQPVLTEKPDVYRGVIAARALHCKVIEETGLVCADELLYPDAYRYIDDLVGYVAIGARSAEDQGHRFIASGIDGPVGMKNPTSGDLTVLMNSITAAQTAHDFMYCGWWCHSGGNPLCHAVLRGFTNEAGDGFSNYHYESIVNLLGLYAERPELTHPALVIDCNHANSHKNPFEQPRIAREVMRWRRFNPCIKEFVKGLMIESYLVDGAQDVYGGEYGKSVTDSCLGWQKTERLIWDIADLA